eukprot:Gb_40878 [translate_table: standard]
MFISNWITRTVSAPKLGRMVVTPAAEDMANRMPRKVPHTTFMCTLYFNLRNFMPNKPVYDSSIIAPTHKELLMERMPCQCCHILSMPAIRFKLFQCSYVIKLYNLVL